MIARFGLVLLCLAPMAGHAEERRSIVGSWRFSNETCSSPIVIGPMSLKSDDVECKFSTVFRRGSVVGWKGICSDAEGSAEEIVIAQEEKGRLTLRYRRGGNVLENLVRCE